MKKACCGWACDSEGAELVMDTMISEGIQIASVTDSGNMKMRMNLSPRTNWDARFHVFGIAEDVSQIARAKQKLQTDQEGNDALYGMETDTE